MKYRLWHLLLTLTLIAISFVLADLYLHRTVVLELSEPWAPGQSKAARQGNEGNQFFQLADDQYMVYVTVHHPDHPVTVWAIQEFGYSPLLNSNVTLTNLHELEGLKKEIRYRENSLPWLPKTTPEEHIEKHTWVFHTETR